MSQHSSYFPYLYFKSTCTPKKYNLHTKPVSLSLPFNSSIKFYPHRLLFRHQSHWLLQNLFRCFWLEKIVEMCFSAKINKTSTDPFLLNSLDSTLLLASWIYTFCCNFSLHCLLILFQQTHPVTLKMEDSTWTCCGVHNYLTLLENKPQDA